MRSKLTTKAWPTGSAELVFGADGVAVIAGDPTEEQIPPGFPWCLVILGNGDPDEDQPTLITQTFQVVSGVNVTGDPMGEFSVVGGAVEELGKSGGRGITEVNERVRNTLQDLTGADGAQILLTTTSIDTPTALVQGGGHITVDSQTFTALCVSGLNYTASQEIAHDGTDWTWTGTQCSNRFDFLQFRLVHKTGSTPATPSDGTTVFTGTGTTFTGVKTAGETYVAFADYNARGGTTVDGSSDPEVGSFLVA